MGDDGDFGLSFFVVGIPHRFCDLTWDDAKIKVEALRTLGIKDGDIHLYKMIAHSISLPESPS